MRNVKVLCTLGPATDGKVKKLIAMGMNGARINMSHGTHAENAARIREVRAASKDVFIVVDTLGPKIRLGDFEDRRIRRGEEVVITTASKHARSADEIPIQYNKFHRFIKKGNTILIEDGLIGLAVKKVIGPRIYCRVLYGDLLHKRKGVNIPYVRFPFPYTTAKDKINIAFALQHKADFIADSFVRNRANVRALRRIMGTSPCKIIAKIENFEGVKNIDEIINEADGIMIARGDLGVELPIEEIPKLQKEIIQKCNQAGKPVITATQMLESMITNHRPTRAEASDVFNAVVDGSDCVMLSGETSIGNYPIEAVKVMQTIADAAEEKVMPATILENMEDPVSLISKAVSDVINCKRIKAIVIPTLSGVTAAMIARYRIKKHLYVLTPNETLKRQLSLFWGVEAFTTKQLNRGDIADASLRVAVQLGLLKPGDIVVVTAGVGHNMQHTNMMQLRKI
ncbi:MAG: pyruvate kinase [Candidatus Omnitrophica bacterium]|nr:pyruvate kinase [Candidatus Omnitrophota bacterium]